MNIIVERDLMAREGRIVTDFSARARTDKSLAGIPGLAKKDPVRAQALAGKLIQNTYRTLMTRGMKRCLVYFVDEETREYFEGRVAKE